MRQKEPAVYILANKKNGTIYTGVTSDLSHRVGQHKTGVFDGFTSRYGVTRLVYFERFYTMDSAIAREKQIKKWKRQWKIELIETMNPEWKDLYDDVCS